MTKVIDRSGRVPAYHQVAMDMERRIANGEWSIGDRLPSEVDLARHYGLSRMTVRQALSVLQRDDVVVRRRPMGTFVAKLPRKLAPTLSIPVSFLQSINALGHAGDVETRQVTVGKAGSREVADALQIDEDTDVIRFERIVTVDNTPAAWVLSIVPHALCPGLEGMELIGNSIHETLQAHFGVSVEQADHWIEARSVSRGALESLGAAEGTQVLALTSLYMDSLGRPVEHVTTHWLAGLMKLHLRTTKNVDFKVH